MVPRIIMVATDASENAKKALNEIYTLAKNTGINVALMCSEKDHTKCHRSVLCEWLEQEHKVEVVHL